MSKQIRSSVLMLILVTGMFLAACGPLPAGAEVKVDPGGQSAQVEFSGIVQSISADQWSIAGQTVMIVPQSVVDGNIVTGDTVKVTAAIEADGQVVAEKIELTSPDSTSTVESTNGNDDNGKKDSDKEVEFIGVVETIARDQWLISGQSFSISNQTEFKDSIVAGETVKVHALVDAGGKFSAREIELVKPEGTPSPVLKGDEMEFKGMAEAIAPDQWIISGVAFTVDANTEIKGTILVGDLVKVEARVGAEGTLAAREIKLADESGESKGSSSTQQAEADMEFTGVVTSIGAEAWTIGGKTFTITPRTEFKGTIVVGDTVKVEASGSPDGMLTAREIKKIENHSGDDSSGSGSDDDNHPDNSGKSTPDGESESHGDNP